MGVAAAVLEGLGPRNRHLKPRPVTCDPRPLRQLHKFAKSIAYQRQLPQIPEAFRVKQTDLAYPKVYNLQVRLFLLVFGANIKVIEDLKIVCLQRQPRVRYGDRFCRVAEERC